MPTKILIEFQRRPDGRRTRQLQEHLLRTAMWPTCFRNRTDWSPLFNKHAVVIDQNMVFTEDSMANRFPQELTYQITLGELTSFPRPNEDHPPLIVRSALLLALFEQQDISGVRYCPNDPLMAPNQDHNHLPQMLEEIARYEVVAASELSEESPNAPSCLGCSSAMKRRRSAAPPRSLSVFICQRCFISVLCPTDKGTNAEASAVTWYLPKLHSILAPHTGTTISHEATGRDYWLQQSS